jgi:hypothetical protein
LLQNGQTDIRPELDGVYWIFGPVDWKKGQIVKTCYFDVKFTYILIFKIVLDSIKKGDFFLSVTQIRFHVKSGLMDSRLNACNKKIKRKDGTQKLKSFNRPKLPLDQ